MNEQTIQKLFNIKYPVIQGGMVWCSGWKLAAAVSQAGGLGLIGAGSMHPGVLKTHINKIKAEGCMYGVNVPLISSYADEIIKTIIEAEVPVVFTSAGSPKKYTQRLHEAGIIVAHVVSSALFALKSEQAGVDAVVAEGFEAGGHNGREESTTLTLTELVKNAVNIPVIAAGGIATGRSILAAEALGADGVQIGSLFAASEESSASPIFKNKVTESGEGETVLTLKKLAPVRMLRNEFCASVLKMEQNGANIEALQAALGKGRAKKGIFEGDLDEGELEIGQSSAHIHHIEPVSKIIQRLISEYKTAKANLNLFFE